MSVIACTGDDLHPYACAADSCLHCSQAKTEEHDPDGCALCHFFEMDVDGES